MSIDLSRLPAPVVVEPLDYETILEELKTRFTGKWPSYSDEPHDPMTKALEVFALRELMLRQRVNDAAKAVMLAHAMDEDLDNLVSFFNIERLEDEGNERLRARAQLSMEGLSNAGTRGSYRYHTLSSSPLVRDCFVEKAAPGVVRITVLSTQYNGQASAALLGTVTQKISADDVRALCDTLEVQSAEIIELNLAVDLLIKAGPDPEWVKDLSGAQITDYFTSKTLGQGVTLSGIYAAAHIEGVFRVGLDLSSDLILLKTQAVYLKSLSITYQVI